MGKVDIVPIVSLFDMVSNLLFFINMHLSLILLYMYLLEESLVAGLLSLEEIFQINHMETSRIVIYHL